MKQTIIGLALLVLGLNIYAQNAGTGLDFDGSDDYIDCGTSTQFEPVNLTVEAWIKADAWRTNNWQGTILSKDSWSGTGGQRGWALRTGDNGRLTLIIAEASSGTWMECMSSEIMKTDKWYHVAGTYDGTTQKVYINGSLVKTLTNTSGIRYSTNDKMILGDCVGQIGNRVFDGMIDEVRLWNVALDSATLQGWMHKPLSAGHPNNSNLVAYYKLDEGTGTTVYDSSLNTFSGTMTNFSTTSAWSASYAPMASHPSNCLNSVASVWSVQGNDASSILEIQDYISTEDYIVFGHNKGLMGYDTLHKPAFIKKRLRRYWRIEKEGSLSGNLIFDYSGLDTGGFDTYKLLISPDTSFSSPSAKGGTKIGGKKIRFKNVSFSDSFFYTIAAYDFQPPYVETRGVMKLRAHSATVSGILMDDGGITATKGICWSTSPNPTADLSTSITKGTGTGSFSVDLISLDSNTIYHYRAFSYNSIDTSYGGDSIFSTPQPQAPTVITESIITMYTDSAYVSGNVTNDGFIDLKEKGFVWDTKANPVINSAPYRSYGQNTGVYYGYVNNLMPNTTYHVRAYAINNVDTSYGGDSIFTTLPILAPTVGIVKVHTIKGYSARVDVDISFDGRRPILEKGVVWDVNPNPTIALSTKNMDGPGDGTFTSKIDSLTPNTTYYVRAYATNVVGTSYSEDSIFITAAPPSVRINSFSSVTYKSAVCNAEVTSDGRRPVSSRGICWGLQSNPDLKTGNVKVSGSGTGTYAISLGNLSINTVYYVRAFAINDVDTAYSTAKSFTTLSISPPTVITKSPSFIFESSALCGGEITADGGASVTERGLCYDTVAMPAIGISNTILNGSGTGSFNSTLSNLKRGTTYHVRAYAINYADTAYGGDSVFTTLGPPLVSTDSLRQTSASKANVWARVYDDMGAIVTSRGICWSTTSMPTARLSTSISVGYGLGSYKGVMTGLTPGMTYYVRAYAINKVDTSYGNQLTINMIALPTVITGHTSNITGTSATGAGDVTAGDNILAKGLVWDINPSPTISLTTKTDEGPGLSSFTGSIIDLTPNTTYYVRAYATNPGGTSYGADSTFTTATVPDVVTYDVSIKSTNTAESGGNVLNDGGMAVTAKGVCWDEQIPTADLSTKTNDGTGTGSFTSTLTSLDPFKKYYVRAYAINGVDTAYGAVKTFTITPPQAITGSTDDIEFNTATLHGQVNPNGLTTSIYFEYGKTASYGSSIFGTPNNISGSTYENITGMLSGLDENTLYHYRIVAENAHGTVYGEDSTFSTKLNSVEEGIGERNISITSYKDEIRILNPTTQEIDQLRVVDVLGHVLLERSGIEGDYRFRMNVSKSMYIVQVMSGGKITQAKIILHK